jgi:hypothetical protein
MRTLSLALLGVAIGNLTVNGIKLILDNNLYYGWSEIIIAILLVISVIGVIQSR